MKSPPWVLEAGAEGRFRGSRFVLVGSVTLRHTSGSIWTEWYASFDDGRKGWVSASGKRAFVTLEVGSFPSLKNLIEGERLLPPFLVAEKGRARYMARSGRLPFDPPLGESYAYVDLIAPGRAFATIDFSEDPPRWFVGESLSLSALSLRPRRARALRFAPEPRRK